MSIVKIKKSAKKAEKMRGITKSEDMKMKINKQNMIFREGSKFIGGGIDIIFNINIFTNIF